MKWQTGDKGLRYTVPYPEGHHFFNVAAHGASKKLVPPQKNTPVSAPVYAILFPDDYRRNMMPDSDTLSRIEHAQIERAVRNVV